MEHRVRVDSEHWMGFGTGGFQEGGGYWWQCTCGATGNTHDSHQTALDHGLMHLKIEVKNNLALG